MVLYVAGWHCQLELILARLDVSDKQETTVYSAFLSEGSRVLAEISLKLTKPYKSILGI